jgi:hypothetical protein
MPFDFEGRVGFSPVSAIGLYVLMTLIGLLVPYETCVNIVLGFTTAWGFLALGIFFELYGFDEDVALRLYEGPQPASEQERIELRKQATLAVAWAATVKKEVTVRALVGLLAGGTLYMRCASFK